MILEYIKYHAFVDATKEHKEAYKDIALLDKGDMNIPLERLDSSLKIPPVTDNSHRNLNKSKTIRGGTR